MPRAGGPAQLRARFDRIFRRRTGLATLDRLSARRLARRGELLGVLERPEIPLHANGSGNDRRRHVIERKVSGGTWSGAGRVTPAMPAGLGLLNTCGRRGPSVRACLGDRPHVPGAPPIPPPPELVRARAPP